MRVTFICSGVPNQGYGSHRTCSFLLLKALREANHNVSVVLLLPGNNIISDAPTREHQLQKLRELNVNVYILSGDLPLQRDQPFFGERATKLISRILWPQIIDYFPPTTVTHELATTLRSLSADVIFIWGSWPIAAATYGVGIAPKFAFLYDLPHSIDLFRSRPPFLSRKAMLSLKWWYSRLRRLVLARVTIRLLSEFDATAMCAAHDAAWVRQNGIPDCKYLPPMIADWGGADWQRRRRQSSNGKLKIILVYSENTPNTSGLYLFANQILPILERKLGSSFEVHICGGGVIPSDLRRKLDRPSVLLRGYVDDFIAELLSCDVYLSPVPIKLGSRASIPYAWSVGCCVITHEANAAGVPELGHMINALVARDGEGLAQAIIRAYADPGLRSHLGLGGRRTYEAHFSYEVTGHKMIAILERLTGPDEPK